MARAARYQVMKTMSRSGLVFSSQIYRNFVVLSSLKHWIALSVRCWSSIDDNASAQGLILIITSAQGVLEIAMFTNSKHQMSTLVTPYSRKKFHSRGALPNLFHSIVSSSKRKHRPLRGHPLHLPRQPITRRRRQQPHPINLPHPQR